jgi:hypothetical protein
MKPKEDKSKYNAIVAIEEIDAKQAQHYLSNLFAEQRPLRENNVLRLAMEMEQGNWRLSPDALLLIRGQLGNGQHRMQAVLLANKPMPFLVMRTNDLELYKVLDCGITRTTWDVLGDMPYAKTVAAMGALICRYDGLALTPGGNNRDRAAKITRSYVLDYIALHRDALVHEASEVTSLNQTKRILSPVLGGAFLHLANRKGNDQGLTFIRNVYIGGAMDAAYDLRERLVRNAGTRAKLRREHVFGLLIKAFGSFCNGTRPGVLRLNEGDVFPKMP